MKCGARHRRGDVGVAVAVAADPRAELEEGRHLELLVRVIFGQRFLQRVEDFRQHLEQGLVEEVQAPGHLALDGGLLQMEFAGHPDELDLVPKLVHQAVALTLGPARQFELAQDEIDAAELLQHRHALSLGGMRRDGRPNAQVLQKGVDLRRLDAVLDRIRQDRAEAAGEFRPPLAALHMATPAHGGILLGDGEELEPDALDLKRAGKKLWREIRDVGRAEEDGFEFRLVAAGDFEQGVEEYVERFLRRGAGDDRRREGVVERSDRGVESIGHRMATSNRVEPMAADIVRATVKSSRFGSMERSAGAIKGVV